jgi:hypothetical protein
VTGFQTTSEFCDESLLVAFAGECSQLSRFFHKVNILCSSFNGLSMRLTDEIFRQTHYPWPGTPVQDAADPWQRIEVDYHYKYDQAVHLGESDFNVAGMSFLDLLDSFQCRSVRNPFDVIASQWHFENPATIESDNRHTNRVEVGKFGAEHRPRIMFFAQAWALHTDYWSVILSQESFCLS